MAEDCANEFSMSDVEKFCTTKVYHKYIKLVKNLEVATNPGLKFCP